MNRKRLFFDQIAATYTMTDEWSMSDSDWEKLATPVGQVYAYIESYKDNVPHGTFYGWRKIYDHSIDDVENLESLKEFRHYERFRLCQHGVQLAYINAITAQTWSEKRKMSDQKIINERLKTLGIDEDFNESSGEEVSRKMAVTLAVENKGYSEKVPGIYWRQCLLIPVEKFYQL